MVTNLLKKGVLASAAAILMVSGSAQKAFAEGVYGAIAYSPSTGGYGAFVSFTRYDAERGAVYNCRQNSGAYDCQAKLWFRDAWGALAVGANGAYGTGWGYHTTYPWQGKRIAERNALNVCRSYGGVNCRVILTRQAIDYNL